MRQLTKIRYVDRYGLHGAILALLGRVVTSLGHSCKAPIFLVGTGRCGSTLLATILKSHKKVVSFHPKVNALWHPNSFPFAEARIETPALVVNPRCYTELSLRNWPLGHKEFIQNIFRGFHLTHSHSKLLLVKSTMVSFMVETLNSMFPDSRFIHIYRNGPSVVASLVKKEWKKHAVYIQNEREFRLCCAAYWNSSIMEIDRVNKSLSLEKRNGLLEFSYEALCDNPKKILGDLEEYLGINKKYFDFDLSRIRSTNYRVGDYVNDKKWAEALELMYPAMNLKGYL